jgi:hypothetical protein
MSPSAALAKREIQRPYGKRLAYDIVAQAMAA